MYKIFVEGRNEGRNQRIKEEKKNICNNKIREEACRNGYEQRLWMYTNRV